MKKKKIRRQKVKPEEDSSKLKLNLGKKLVKRYFCSRALYGAETWTLRKVNHKCLESFEMWCWRNVEKTRWIDHVRNEEVLQGIKAERNIPQTAKRMANWIGHFLGRNCFLKHFIEGKIQVTGRRLRRCKQIPNDLIE